jgi:protein-tyrosine phosphatase
MHSTQNSKFKIQNCQTDWHCHILPGIDDGPATMEESVEMAKALYAAGYRKVLCTPHLIKGSFEADNATVRASVVALQACLAREHIPLELLPGREYYLDEFLLDYLKDPLPLGSTNYLLIELPNHISIDRAKETFYRIKCSGFTPMIAHPERCKLFELSPPAKTGLRELFNVQGSTFKVFNAKLKTQDSKLADNSLLAYLQEIDCLFQGNLRSFTGFYGNQPRRSAQRLNAAKVYTHFGTDLHSVQGSEMLTRVGLRELISGSREELIFNEASLPGVI